MKKKWIFLRVFGFFFFVFLFLFLFFFFSQKFILRKVFIMAQKAPFRGLGGLNGQNVLFLNLEVCKKKILAQNPELKNLEIKKIFPNSLVFLPKFRTALAVLEINESIRYFLDEDGVVFRGEQKVSLPKIKLRTTHFFPSRNDWRVMKAFNYLKFALKLGIFIHQIEIEEGKDFFVILLEKDGQVVTSIFSNPPTTLTSLQIILSRFRIEGKFIKKIDLRGEKPRIILQDEEKISSNHKEKL